MRFWDALPWSGAPRPVNQSAQISTLEREVEALKLVVDYLAKRVGLTESEHASLFRDICRQNPRCWRGYATAGT
jgi:hypothetical protein